MRAWLRVLLALCVLLGAAPAWAEAPAEPEGIVGRVIVRGTRYIEEAAVLDDIGLRPGDRITRDRIRRDLVAVWNTGFFQDVAIEADDLPDGTVKLIFTVTEKPAVVDVRLDGNKKIKEEDLNEKIDVKSFGVLNESKVQGTVQRIRDAYIEKGFYLAEVDPEIVEVGPGRVEVVFHITENRKVLIQRIELIGNDHVTDRKIKQFLFRAGGVSEAGPLPWIFTNRGRFDRLAVQDSQQIVQQIYYEEGYLDIAVDPPKVYLSPDKRFIYISYHLDEGPQYDIGNVSASGEFIPEEGLDKKTVLEVTQGRKVEDVQQAQWRVSRGKKPAKILLNRRAGPKLEPGETFKASLFAEVRGNVERLYKDRGYATVNVIPRTVPDKESLTVDLDFGVDTGNRYRIGRIDIEGNDPTIDKVIRRELLIREGELYRGSYLDASRYQLMRRGWFESVEIRELPASDDVMDLKVAVKEKPTGSFSLGVGFGSAEGFSIQGSVSKSNIFGLGYTVNASVQWSQRQQNISVSFLDPYFVDSRWLFSLSGFWIERDFQVREYRRGARIGIGRYLDRLDDVVLELSYEVLDFGLRFLDASRRRLYGGNLFANGVTSTIGLNLRVDKRNNQILPTKGFYASLAGELSGGFRVGDQVVSLFGGDFNFAEIDANFRWYQPLIPKSDQLVFRFNTTLGFLFSTDGDIVPFNSRFGAGGINSVRGFAIFSLGPTVRTSVSDDPSAGDSVIRIRGTQIWVNNFEIETQLVRAAGLKGVVFFDAGNAFGDAYGEGAINPLDLRTSVGFGIRWQSPIGPLRFELGFPLAPREDERPYLFDFSIGSFF